MHLNEFYQGISLMPEAVKRLEQFACREVVLVSYEKHKKMFYEAQEQYFEVIREFQDYRLWFLYEYCRMSMEVWKDYRREEIGEKIYWDTFSDLTIWCGNCLQEYGEYGLEQEKWLFRHIKRQLFRLGRLQFEIPGEEELQTVPKSVRDRAEALERALVFVHIPQGEPLYLKDCEASVLQAVQFFEKRGSGEANKKTQEAPVFVCHSWLLGENLNRLLQENSNIRKFQKMFQITEQDYETREAEERIFGKILADSDGYPENTSLQIQAKRFLLSGGRLGNGFGVIF